MPTISFTLKPKADFYAIKFNKKPHACMGFLFGMTMNEADYFAGAAAGLAGAEVAYRGGA